jgi:hypothetical protein
MAVDPDHHRHGIGRAMVEHLEDGLARSGVEFLQVKTLSPTQPDAGYEKTRAFYLACGFRPLEEFPTLWDPWNPALQLVKSITPPTLADHPYELGEDHAAAWQGSPSADDDVSEAAVNDGLEGPH